MILQARDLLDNGVVVVTASTRQARHLRYQYEKMQTAAAVLAWESPDILPWSAWLQRLWDTYSFRFPGQLLLSPVQELAVWRGVIEDSTARGDIWSPHLVAKRARQAWELICQYQIPPYSGDIHPNEDVHAFTTWLQRYQEQCRKHEWLDNASLPDLLTSVAGKLVPDSVTSFACHGFERFTPQQQKFIEALVAHGVEFTQLSPAQRNNSVTAYVFPDRLQETRTVANWAGMILEREPQASIGIVTADLHQFRAEISYQFEDALIPASIIEHEHAYEYPFSLSAGRPLNEYPLIHAALQLLELGRDPVPVQLLNFALHTPFMKSAETERLARAWFEAYIRDYGELQLSRAGLAFHGQKLIDEEQSPRIFLTCLGEMHNYLQALPQRLPLYEWGRHIQALLQICGWPGERESSSTEYQQIMAWQDAMERFIGMQLVEHKPLGYAQAIATLARVIREFDYQPQTAETPVQIMGVQGAAAMEFDYLWIMGMHEESWPPAAQANPFIPIPLQRQFELPNATAQISLTHASGLLASLVRSVPEVILSYPANDQERPLRASALLKAYADINERPDLIHKATLAETLFRCRDMETFVDEMGPAVREGESVSGGAGLFRDQSACPFRAFARHRLSAETLSEVDIGLNPMQRGLIIHRIMQLVWEKIVDQSTLLALDPSALDTIINTTVDATITSWRRIYPQTFTERFAALESHRLKRIVAGWLEQERLRSGFSVKERERKRRVSFAGIDINLVLDRVDQLPDGREVIIDYKTGDTKVKQWLGERPEEPQLPLYAVTNAADVAALCFARLRNGDLGYVGLAQEEGIIPGVEAFADSRYAQGNSTWAELLENWRGILSGLAADFRAGHAEVDPDSESSCRYCDQKPFCRIYEIAADGLLLSGDDSTHE